MTTRQIKSVKAAKQDNIPTEALKADIAVAAYLQLKNIWNSKQLSVNQHQVHNFRYKCQNSSTVWGGNLENYECHHPEDTGVY
ncbi:unnamed protein product [Schistosoma curassoni]|uniref:SCP domain-containing protein n=1 Tax=Schistosoma curassoni TaxID=6186 RepID=A0A183KBZ4_9TREM|nr:unnamed protein product [Schistosoma curassoni]